MSGDHKKYAVTGKPTGYAKGGSVKGGGKVKLKKELELSVPPNLKGALTSAIPTMGASGGPPAPSMPPAPTMPAAPGAPGMKRGGRAKAMCKARKR